MSLLTDPEKSINDETVSVKVINPTSFLISQDARLYTAYERNGIAKQVKVPRKLEFKTLEELESAGEDQGIDANLLIADFEKLDVK
jgi:hypothetical protein